MTAKTKQEAAQGTAVWLIADVAEKFWTTLVAASWDIWPALSRACAVKGNAAAAEKRRIEGVDSE